MGSYWRRIHKRALARTVAALGLGSWLAIIGKVLTAATVVGLLLFVGSQDAPRDELIARVGAALLVALFFPLVYVWQFLRAPSDIDAEERAEAEEREAALQAAISGNSAELAELQRRTTAAHEQTATALQEANRLKQKDLDDAPKSGSLEVDRIRGDVTALVEEITSHRPLDAQRDSILTRYKRLEESDHVAWSAPALRQLRRDFLNRCGIMIEVNKRFDSAEEFNEARREVSDLASQIGRQIDQWQHPRPMPDLFVAGGGSGIHLQIHNHAVSAEFTVKVLFVNTGTGLVPATPTFAQWVAGAPQESRLIQDGNFDAVMLMRFDLGTRILLKTGYFLWAAGGQNHERQTTSTTAQRL